MRGAAWMLLAVCSASWACDQTEPDMVPSSAAPVVEAEVSIVWHNTNEADDEYADWRANYIDEYDQTPYEYVFEFSLGPTDIGVRYEEYEHFRWVGLGGPFQLEDGRVHMYACGMGSKSVYRRGDLVIDCRSASQFFVVILALEPVAAVLPPSMPEPYASYWAEQLAYSLHVEATERAKLIQPFNYYTLNHGEWFAVPVKFDIHGTIPHVKERVDRRRRAYPVANEGHK